MSITIIKRLDPKLRKEVVDGAVECKLMSAFIGVDGDILPSFGIGLVDENDNVQFWGLTIPHRLITAWRGMYILDQATIISNGTLCYCYEIGKRDLKDSDKRSLNILQDQIPDINNFRKKILATSIDNDELNAMLSICNSAENDIDVAIWELEDEIASKTINRTTEVLNTIAINKTKVDTRTRNVAISKKQLPSDQSFKKFCEDFKIRNLCGMPGGIYGADWGHIDMDYIDEEIVYTGLSIGRSRIIFCTKEPEGAKNFGAVGYPVLHTNTDRNIKLSEVLYKDGDMYVCFSEIGKEDSGEEEQRLSDLRKLEPHMIGVSFCGRGKYPPKDIERGFVSLT